MHLLPSGVTQVIEELFTYWNLDDADETLEELEDALIVRPAASRWQPCASCGLWWLVVVGPPESALAGWRARVLRRLGLAAWWLLQSKGILGSC